MSIAKRPGRLPPSPHPRQLDGLGGLWVAMLDGEVIAANASSLGLEHDLRRLGPAAEDAVVRKVNRPTQAVTVGLG